MYTVLELEALTLKCCPVRGGWYYLVIGPAAEPHGEEELLAQDGPYRDKREAEAEGLAKLHEITA